MHSREREISNYRMKWRLEFLDTITRDTLTYNYNADEQCKERPGNCQKGQGNCLKGSRNRAAERQGPAITGGKGGLDK